MSSSVAFFLALVAAVAYVLSGSLALRQPGRRLAQWLPVLALSLHLVLLGAQLFRGDSVVIGVREALSLFAWQSALLLWLFCLREPLQVLGVLVYPFAGLAAVTATVLPSPMQPIAITEWKVQLHIVLSLLSAGLLTLAAVQAVALALQDRLLHGHTRLGLMQALPPLQTMEQLLFQLIALGFFLLSLSLLSGMLFIHNLFAQHLAHKTVLSIVAWALFGLLLWGRWRHGWRGRAAIRWALSGYGALILAYFGSKWVLEQFLHKQWS
jgi:ABC-type uncharacterized transport system permease subunit